MARAQEPPPPAASSPTPAPDAAPPPAADAERVRALEQRLEELDQRQRILERNLEIARDKDAEKAKDRPSVAVEQGKGLTVTSGDKRFSVTVRSRIQARESVVHANDTTTSEANIKTLRLIVSGNALSPDLKYYLQLAFGGGDFEAGSSSPIFDAFVEYTRLRDLNVRFGQYFVPFDRARTIREFALQFVDRQQPVVEFNLDRDVGLMFFSNDLFGWGGRLAYNVGVFGGDGKNRFGGGEPGFLYVARLTLRPFGPFDDDQEADLTRADRPRLAIGIAGAYNQATARQRSTIGGTYVTGTFDYAHAAADLVFKYAGFSFLGEVLWRQGMQDGRAGKDATGKAVTDWTRSGWGYLAQGGYMLTSQLEVSAKWTQMFALDITDPALVTFVKQQGKEIGAGVNLYLKGHIFKIQGDYSYLFGDDAAAGRHIARIQIDASF